MNEKMKNFFLYNFYGTDEELEKTHPYLLIIVILAIIILVGTLYLS